MSINRTPSGPPPMGGDHEGKSKLTAQAAAAILKVDRKKVKVKRGAVRRVALGMAEVAHSMGKTNDVDAFAEEMTDVILAAFNQIDSEQKRP